MEDNGKYIPNNQQWKEIFNNEIERSLKHDGRGYKVFYDPGNGKVSVIHLKGITKALSTKFWPGFMPVKTNMIGKGSSSANNKNRVTFANGNKDENNHYIAKQKKPGSWDAARIAGLVRGTEVHNQLKTYTQLMQFHIYGINNQEHNQHALNNFKGIHPNCHPCTESILKHMRNMGWVPVRASIPVFNPETTQSKWATEIDLIAIDPRSNNKLILIELKTGYNGNFMKGSKQMGNKMNLNNSPLNQAKVQLVASAMLFTKMYSNITRYAMYVIWCSSDGSSIQSFNVTTDQYAHIHQTLCDHWFFEKPKVVYEQGLVDNKISMNKKRKIDQVKQYVYIEDDDDAMNNNTKRRRV